MFKIVHKITAENLVGFEELESWLDDNFHLNYKLDDGSIYNKLILRIDQNLISMVED